MTVKPALPPRAQTLRSVPHLKSRQQQVKLVVKGRAAVDPSCPMADDCHVYEAGNDMCAMRSFPVSQSVSECHTATAMGHRLTRPRSVPEPAHNQYVISA